MNKHKEKFGQFSEDNDKSPEVMPQSGQVTEKNSVEVEEKTHPNMQGDDSSKKIAELEKSVFDLTQQLAIAEDKYLRLNAEFDNFRKRALRDRDDVRINTQFEILGSVIPVLDHFEFAMTSVEQSKNLDKLFEGMKLIKVEFERALTSQGVEFINAVGQPFDPKIHEGVAHETSEEFEKDVVSKQWRIGYKMGDRVIRPATVVISSGKSSQNVVKDSGVF